MVACSVVVNLNKTHSATQFALFVRRMSTLTLITSTPMLLYHGCIGCDGPKGYSDREATHSGCKLAYRCKTDWPHNSFGTPNEIVLSSVDIPVVEACMIHGFCCTSVMASAHCCTGTSVNMSTSYSILMIFHNTRYFRSRDNMWRDITPLSTPL